MYLDLLLKMGKSSWSTGITEDRYKPSKQIRFKTSILRAGLCDFSYAYIVVKGTIVIEGKIIET